MKFEIAKRGVDVRWNHVWLFLGVQMAFAIILGILSAAIAYIVTGIVTTDFFFWAGAISSILGGMFWPAAAWVYLSQARDFKFGRDVGFCRGMAAAGFLVASVTSLAMSLLLFVRFGSGFPGYGILENVRAIASFGFGAVISYLWLLVFLKPDRKKMMETAKYAVIFAVMMLVVSNIVEVLIPHFSNLSYDLLALEATYTLSKPLSLLSFLLVEFVFGFVLLYHVSEMKKLDEGAYLFIGMYLVYLLLGLVPDIDSLFGGHWSLGGLFILIDGIIGLCLVYLLSRLNLKDISI